MRHIFLRRIAFTLLISVLGICGVTRWAGAATSAKQLPATYRHWLEVEVPYIISGEERKEFLSLNSDAERENFIKAFWDERNPSPDPSVNPYKEEHYRRLAYANENFGDARYQNGWRTDMGRMYIILGAPKLKSEYKAARNIRDMQIWFYQGSTPALPPYFNLIFYKRSPIEPYRLYSPIQDGPVRLINSGESQNDPKISLNILKRSLGDEIAKTTISLLPNTAVDLNDFTPSMESDMMLGTISGLADNPITKQQIALRKAHEHVNESIFLGPDQGELQSAVLRDEQNRPSVHFLITFREPDPTSIGTLPDKKTGYSFSLQSDLSTVDSKPVYQDIQKLTAVISDAQATIARRKRFGAEGRLPLVPGQYKLTVTLTNDLTRAAIRQQVDLNVPAPDATGWSMSKLITLTRQPPTRVANAVIPFTFGGIRFAPRGVQDATVHAGDNLGLLFQLWSDPKQIAALQSSKIHITYVAGKLQSGEVPHEESEDIDGSGLDTNGNLISGHLMQLQGFVPGTYRLVVTAADPITKRKAFAAMNFRVAPDTEATDIWTAFAGVPAGTHSDAEADYRRGLCASSLGQTEAAAGWLQRSLADDPSYRKPVTKLIALLEAAHKYAEINQISRKYPITGEVDDGTVLAMADAAERSGDYNLATQILKAVLTVRSPSALVYRALADAYGKAGELAKAKEYNALADHF